MGREGEEKIGVVSALSIGIGGLVGGGIFAVLGLAATLARGATPIAFLIAGVVALVTCYSYVKLSISYPSEGGTVAFLIKAFGKGFPAGGLNALLCLSYVIIIAVYAYAFAAYGVTFFPAETQSIWKHVLITFIVVILTLLNAFSPSLVLKSENIINAIKLSILLVFIIVGLSGGIVWKRLAVSNWVPALDIIASGMVIFISFEGFELIANASRDVKKPKRNLPIAYYTSVLLAMVFYLLIAIVALGHLSFEAIEGARDYSLAASAKTFMGQSGFILIVIGALLATGSAINADLYGSSRIMYLISQEGELPEIFQRQFWHRRIGGLIAISVVALLAANFLELHAIAVIGSAGFLLVFAAVNIANIKLFRQTNSRRWISALGAPLCFSALTTMLFRIYTQPEHRYEVWLIAAIVILSFGFEVIYRRVAKNK